MAMVEREARRRTESGELPAELVRELDRDFSLFAPDPTGQGQGKRRRPAGAGLARVSTEAVRSAERAAPIDAAVPTAGVARGKAQAERMLGRAMGWYVRYLAQQLSAFDAAAVRSLRLLVGRVKVLEDRAGSRPALPLLPAAVAAEPEWWWDLALTHVGRAPGRVLHAECGAGGLVSALVAAGTDAYGIDPSLPALAAPG
ncbi:MAG: hypothetical protein ACRD0J_10450, partial [Acidimicrobiales bacterium]